MDDEPGRDLGSSQGRVAAPDARGGGGVADALTDRSARRGTAWLRTDVGLVVGLVVFLFGICQLGEMGMVRYNWRSGPPVLDLAIALVGLVVLGLHWFLSGRGGGEDAEASAELDQAGRRQDHQPVD